MKSIKNLLLTAAAVVTATVAATAVISFGVQAKYGDINNDGNVDTADLVRLMKYIAADGDGVEAVGTDLNNDNITDTRDLIRLMKYIADPGAFDTDPPETDPEEPEETVAHEDEVETPLTEMNSAVGRIEKESDAAAVENWKEILDSAIEKTANLEEADIKASRTLKSTDNSMIYERIGNLKLRTSEDGITRGKLRESVTDGIDTVNSYIFYGAGKAYLPLLEDPSYIEGKLAGYKFKEMASLYLPADINTSALSGVCANKNSDGSVTLSLSADAGMLSGSSLDVISLRTEGLTHLPKIENPADPTSIKLNCSINKDGYITYLDIEFSFGATLRIDPSNTRQKTMSYKMAVSLDNAGEKIAIGEPADLDSFIPYDIADELTEVVKSLYINGSKIDGFDEKYQLLCELYGKDNIDDTISELGYTL